MSFAENITQSAKHLTVSKIVADQHSNFLACLFESTGRAIALPPALALALALGLTKNVKVLRPSF